MNSNRRNARGEATLRRILHATVDLIGRYGYDNTTIARIVTATQRPASSIYWYFETKDELIAAALEDSYSKVPRSHRPWDSTFDPDRPLLDQLMSELGPELLVTESERSLRLGIMLALEGSAATSKVQEPFRRRRAAALTRVQAWWTSVFASHPNTGGINHTAGILWMTTLSLTFLDGHYISDIVVDEQAAIRRSRILARALDGAFRFLLESAQSLAREPDIATSTFADEASGGKDRLLRVTRSLIAEHGYEGATISRICAAAQMQRSSVYWRYKDKDALVKAAVAEPFLALLNPLQSLTDPTDGWPELSRALETIMDRVQAEPDTVKAGLLLKMQRWEPPTLGGSAVLEGSSAAEADLAAFFGRIVPEEHDGPVGRDLAWIVARFIDGFMLAPALGNPVRADSATKILIPLLTSGSNPEPLPTTTV